MEINSEQISCPKYTISISLDLTELNDAYNVIVPALDRYFQNTPEVSHEKRAKNGYIILTTLTEEMWNILKIN